MKIFALLAAVCTVIACQPAEARSIKRFTNEVLQNVEINGEKTDLTGLLNIDYMERTINVQIVKDICGQYKDLPPGTVRCMAMAMPVDVINVPFKGNRADGCGSYVTESVQNDLPRDGMYQAVKIVDNKFRTCDDVIESILVIDAKTIAARSNKETVYHITK